MRQHHLVPGSGEGDVEEPALLPEMDLVVGRRRFTDELGWHRQGLAPAGGREAAGHEARQVDDRELEPLRLVDGQDRDRVHVGVELGGRRVVARLDQRLEMSRDERGAIVGEQRRLRPDDLEETGDVAEGLLGGDRWRRGQPPERPGLPQEGVQDLRSGPLVRQQRELPEVFDQAVPSGNGMAARLLVRLWLLSGEGRYEEYAAKMFRLFAGILEHAPRAAEHLLLAFMAWSESKPGAVAAASSAGASESGRGQAAGLAPGTPESGGGTRGPLARAQRGPVIVSADGTRRIRAGESFELRLTLEIEPGWHVQSANPSRNDRAATSVELGLAEGLTPGEMKFPEGSLAPLGGEKLPVYTGRVTIRVPIQADPSAPRGKTPLVARVRFQSCDDKRCLAPEQVELSFSVEVV